MSSLAESLYKAFGPMFAGAGERLTIWIEPAVAHDPEMMLRKWQFAATRDYVSADEFRRHVLNLPDRGTVDNGNEQANTAEVAEAVAVAGAAGGADVQATALNGAQIDSLLKIAELVTSGELSKEAARALIAAAFPLLPSERISAIVDSLSANPNAAPDASQVAKYLNPYSMLTKNAGELFYK